MATALEGERRWTTVLFTDMANFSSVSEAIGAERVYALLSKVIGIASECIDRNGGHLVDYAGDSILAAFGAPVALENASLHACIAAQDFQDTIAAHAAEFEAEFNTRPLFRVGLAGGTIVLGQLGLSDKLDVTIMGEAVNEAARLEALARPGEILLSSAVYQQVEGFVITIDLGERELKGFTRKSRVYRLQGIRDDSSRFEGLRRRGLVEFVGRRQELDLLLGAVAEAPTELRVVSVSAPAGMGKSRLIHEFRERLAGSVDVLVGQCNPSTVQVAYGPFTEIVRLACGIPRDATPETVADRIRPLLANGADAGELHALFAGSAHLRKRGDTGDMLGDALRLREQMQQIIAALGRNRSQVLIVEDAHWIDGLSLELIGRLALREKDSGMLLIVSHRPGFTADWMEAPHCRRITLQPLNSAESATLVEKGFGTTGVSPRLSRIIAEKAEGNPLFAEEIIRFLRSGNKLQLTGGRYDLAEAGEAELMSGNLQHLVLSRVDALPGSVKSVLQLAAAIGRQFSSSVLKTIAGDAAIVDLMCERCTAEGLIERDPTGLDEDWRFTHALIRDAVYGSLLTSQRAPIHARIADAIRRHAGNRERELAESLAYHYGAAGNAEMAVKHLAVAAEKSQRLYAFDQAGQQLAQAFAFIEREPGCVDEELYGSLVLTWLRSLEQAGNFGALIRTADRLLPRMRGTGVSTDLLVATTLCAIAKTHTRDYHGARQMAEEALAQAEARGDKHSAAWARAALMRIYEETGWAGRETLEAFARDIKPVAEAFGDTHLAMMAVYLLSCHYRTSGEIIKARALAQQLQSFAQEHGDRRAMAYSLWALGLISFVAGDPGMAKQLAEQALEHSLPNSADANVAWAVWAHAQIIVGDAEVARSKVDELLATSTAFEDYNLIHSMVLTKAILLIKSGKLAQGWKMLEGLMPVLETAGNLAFQRQIRLMRAEVLLVVAGLARPAVTSAANGESSPRRPKLGLRDILTGLYLRLIAKKEAEAELDAYCRAAPLKGGAGYARAQIGLGVIARARGQNEAAMHFLAAGRAMAAEEQLGELVARADRLLAEVP